MSTFPSGGLKAHYDEIENSYSIVEGSNDWATLVVPNGNSREPFHRWFHFKEGYSHRILDRIVAEGVASTAGGTTGVGSVFDPFSGSGTTAVSAISLNRRSGRRSRVHAIERNPVMHAVSRAKITGVAMGSELAERIRSHEASFWKSLDLELDRPDAFAPTGSSTLDNRTYYTADSVATLRAMSRAARSVPDEAVSNHLIALAAGCVEPAGMLRRDGRALRFTRGKRTQEPRKLFALLLEDSLEDLDAIGDPYTGEIGIDLGDARDPSLAPGSKFDWAVCSPPYPNNIDYTEVYKIEAWALGFFSSADDMRAQRLSTLRSHPSITFPEEYMYSGSPGISGAVEELIAPLLASIPVDRYMRGRQQLIRGYTDDMLRVLQLTAGRLVHGGRAAIIVGNSLHGSKGNHFLVASDLIIARLGELAGLRVDSVLVARRPQRRAVTESMLRESVVFFTR